MFVAAVLIIDGDGVSAQGPRPGGTPPPSSDALERWIRATSGGATPTSGDTKFLASLSDSERHGAFLYRQRCYTCHVSRVSPRAYGPPLSRLNVQGKDEAVRQLILDGTERMPAFRYGLELSQIDLILAYLKRVEP
jgi:mono/diheme cytochrome c family protein